MKPKSIKKNYIYNLVYQILVIIIPLVTAPYLSRVLGVEGVGIYSYTLSNVSYFILLANVGIASFGQREIAMNQDNRKKYSKVFWDLYGYQLLIGLVAVLFYLVYVFFFSKYTIIQAVLIVNLFSAIIDITWLFQGLEEYKYISIRNIVVKLVFTAAIFIFVHSSDDLLLYLGLNAGATVLSAGIMWLSAHKILNKPKFKEIRVFKYWKDTIIYFLPQIATQIYTILDKTMLGLITGSQVENGYYEQAYRITSIVMTVITSLNIVIAPRMAYLYKKGDIAQIRYRLAKSLRFVFLLSIPMTIGLMIVGPGFSQWFFGPGYEKVQILMPVIAPIIFIIAISNCLGVQCLTPCGKRAKSAMALWIGAGVNLISNLILIPHFAGIGAAIGTIIAETTITVLFIIFSRKYIDFKTAIKGMRNYIIGGILMTMALFITLHFLPEFTPVNTIIAVAVGVLTYGATMIVTHDEFVFEYIDLIKHKFLKR